MATEAEIRAVARGLEDLYGDAMAATPVSESWRQDAKEILEAAERARASEDKVETACKAARVAFGYHYTLIDPAEPWESLPESSRADWCRAMRAALEAIGAEV